MLGPDGAGKSTIVNALNEKLQFDLCYLGYGDSRSYYFSRLIEKLGNDMISRILSRILVTVDDYIKAFSSVTFNRVGTIIDRYPCDNIVNTILDSRKSVSYHKFLFRFFPKADVFILLVGEPSVLYERKKEIPVERIKNYIETYKRVLIDYKVNYIVIDTTKMNVTECIDKITENVNEI